MVSTRNAAHSAPSVISQARSRHRSGATQPVGLPDQLQNVDGAGLRKRARNASITSGEAPDPQGLWGARSPNAKRAKSRILKEETILQPRREEEPSAQEPFQQVESTTRDTGLSLGLVHTGSDLPTLTGHSGPVNGQDDLQNDGELSFHGPTNPFSQGFGLRTQSLPVLDNFATQILNIIVKSTLHEIRSMMATSQTGAGQQWSLLFTLFTETKKIYTEGSPLLSAQNLGLSGKSQVDTIKKANLATFVCSLLGGREDISFEYLDSCFLDIFSVDGTKLLKPQAELFIKFKTQAYISAVTNEKLAILQGQVKTKEILKNLFPFDQDLYFLHRRTGATQLTAIERYFVDQVRIRSEILLAESRSAEAIDKLPSIYPQEVFQSIVLSYIKAHFNELMGVTTARRPGRPRQEQNVFRAAYGNEDLQIENPSNDIAEKAARAAHFAMETFSHEAQQHAPAQSQTQRSPGEQTPFVQQGQTSQAPGLPIQFHFERPLQPNVPSPPPPFFTQLPYQNGQMQGQWHPGSSGDAQLHQSYEAEGAIPYPTQSAPTHVLYERARQAASSKPSQQQTPRKVLSNTPAQRRPWTPDEENALMAGLDRVKGPHWSQIHAMFGPGGTINDVLKDRNQVQLKDKARNLKLFFLKSNIEVPYYLQFVTGELKTRAPSRVAKNEARQKAMSEEDRAHVQGVLTLAGTANGGEGGLEDEQGEETEQQHMMRLAASATNDVNIDPALEAQLRQAAAEDNNSHALGSGGRYTVPTPNMLMQNLEKFIGASNAADSSKR